MDGNYREGRCLCRKYAVMQVFCIKLGCLPWGKWDLDAESMQVGGGLTGVEGL